MESAVRNVAVGMSEGSGQAGEGPLFPASPRMIFAAAPLTEVVAQVRFPPILKIEQTPADFQDRIRAAFPFFEKVAGPNILAGAPELPQEFLQLLGNQMAGITYRFKTENQHTTL